MAPGQFLRPVASRLCFPTPAGEQVWRFEVQVRMIGLGGEKRRILQFV